MNEKIDRAIGYTVHSVLYILMASPFILVFCTLT
jgi:hypothetical protein